MKLREIEYPAAQIEYFARLKELGGVLDVCILAFDQLADVYAGSQAAAILAMRIYAAKYSSVYFQIRIDEDRLPVGEMIDHREFLGEGFDFERLRVDQFQYSDGGRSTNGFDGLVRALLDPPYGVRVMPRGEKFSVAYGVEEQTRMTGVLFEFLKNVVGIDDLDDFESRTIYRWSDDWSNYFNAGREWWGTFYWTILNPQSRTITVIGASQTD